MRRTGGAAAVLAGLMLAVLPVAGPASAHDGKLKLEVAGDGATGVTVQAKHADGHRLEAMVRLVVSATASGGRSVGPLQLEPAGEGQGFYASGPILTPGDWRVTVSAPAPYTSQVTAEVRAAPAQAAPAVAAPARPAAESSWRPWLIGLGVLAIVALLVVAVGRRRRQPV